MTIPALPYDNRTVTYTPSVATSVFDIDFPVFGDGSDIEVKVNNAVLTYGPDYTILSHSGVFSAMPSPVEDAYISLTTAVTGTVILTGKSLPRRTAQASAPFDVDDFNRAFTQLVAILQEQDRDIKTALGVIASATPLFTADTSGLLDLLSATRGAVLSRQNLGWRALLPGSAGQGLISMGSGQDPVWGTTRGLHYDDYFRKWGTHTIAMQKLVTDVYALAAAGTPCSVNGDGNIVTLLTNFDVATQAGRAGASISCSVRFHNFIWKCDPTWPQPTFATTFGGILSRLSTTITGIADTSALVVGQVIEHRNIPMYSTIASKTANSITLQNAYYPAQPTKTAGVTKTADTTSGSKVLANVSGTSQLITGLSITGTNVPAGATVDQIILTFTMSSPATATATGVAVTAAVTTGSGQVTINCTADTVNTSATVTLYVDAQELVTNGMVLNGAGIPSNVTLSAKATTSLRMSVAATGTAVGTTFTFGTAPADLKARPYITGNTTANGQVVTGIPSTAGLRVGMTIDVVGCCRDNAILSIDSATQITLARPVWNTVTGAVLCYRADAYLLDFSAFASLEYTTIDHCTFLGNDVGNAVLGCQNQLAMNVEHCYVLDHAYWGVRIWSPNGGAGTVERCRFSGSAATQYGSDISRTQVHIRGAGSDVKFIDNQGKGFLIGILLADGGKARGNHFFNQGGSPTIVAQDDGYKEFIDNYVDTGGIELSNEARATDAKNGIGNVLISSSYFKTNSGPSPVYSLVKARPCAALTPFHNVVITPSVGKQGTGTGGNHVFLTGVDTTNGTLDVANFTGIYVRYNPTEKGMVQMNPLPFRGNRASVASATHAFDVTGLLPFGGTPKFLVGGVSVMNAGTPTNAPIQNVTISGSVITVTTAGTTTGDFCMEVNCNIQATPRNAATQAANITIFTDASE